MKKKYCAVFFAAFAVLLVLAGCASTEPAAGTTVVTITDADFKSDAGGSLQITNMTSEELAIFVGKVERGNLIGALGQGANGRGKSRLFDLNKISGLPDRGTFLIRATTFSRLNEKGLAGITEEDVVYTGLITFDKKDPGARIEHDIYKNIDVSRTTFIHVTNRSRYALQLRVDASDGDTVAVLAPGQRLKKIWMKPNDDGLPYEFFPSYAYVDARTGEMNVFSDPENVNGKRFEPEPMGPDVREITFTGPGSGGPQFNVAFVRFQNDTDELCNFMTAEGNYRKNERGSASTSPGRTDTYQIDSGSGKSGRTYSALTVKTDSGFVKLNPLTVLPGYVYDLVFTKMDGTYRYDVKTGEQKSVADNIRFDLFGE
ncbi:MAG: hypothetical protein LBQ57_14040 [Spirochaetales bacterium]|jgi:hypothetical protein|nr:hypothetical protein [Spirochaetales bacterium]